MSARLTRPEIAEYRLRWDGHRAKCERCQRYIPGKTMSLAYVCAEGAPLIRELLINDYRAEQYGAENNNTRAQAKKSLL